MSRFSKNIFVMLTIFIFCIFMFFVVKILIQNEEGTDEVQSANMVTGNQVVRNNELLVPESADTRKPVRTDPQLILSEKSDEYPREEIFISEFTNISKEIDKNIQFESLRDYIDNHIHNSTTSSRDVLGALVSNIPAMTNDEKDLAFLTLKVVGDMKVSPQLIEQFYDETIKYKKETLGVLSLLVSQHKLSSSWTEHDSQYSEIKDFFIANLNSFDPSLNIDVYKAIAKIFPKEERDELLGYAYFSDDMPPLRDVEVYEFEFEGSD